MLCETTALFPSSSYYGHVGLARKKQTGGVTVVHASCVNCAFTTYIYTFSDKQQTFNNYSKIIKHPGKAASTLTICTYAYSLRTQSFFFTIWSLLFNAKQSNCSFARETRSYGCICIWQPSCQQ